MNTDEIIKGLFEAIDEMDADKFASFLHDDATFIFGNAEPVKGKKAVRENVAGFFSAIKGISHTLKNIVGHDSEIVCRGKVKYTRHDGSTLEVPFANYFTIDEGLIRYYQIYVDASQLFSS